MNVEEIGGFFQPRYDQRAAGWIDLPYVGEL